TRPSRVPYQTGTARSPVPPSPGTSTQATVLFLSASESTSVSDPVDQGGSSSSTAMGTRPTSSPSTSRTSSWSSSESTVPPWTSSVKVSILLEPRRVRARSGPRQTTSPLGASTARASRYQPPAPVWEGGTTNGGSRPLPARPTNTAIASSGWTSPS